MQYYVRENFYFNGIALDNRTLNHVQLWLDPQTRKSTESPLGGRSKKMAIYIMANFTHKIADLIGDFRGAL